MPTERAIKEDRSREKNEVLVRRKRNQTPVLLPCRCSFSFSARAFINYVFAHRQHACERRWEVKRRRERRNGRKRKCRKKLCAIIPQLLEISVSINLVSCTIRFFRDSSRLFLPLVPALSRYKRIRKDAWLGESMLLPDLLRDWATWRRTGTITVITRALRERERES